MLDSTACNWIPLDAFIKRIFHNVLDNAVKYISAIRVWLIIHLPMLYIGLPVSVRVGFINETLHDVGQDFASYDSFVKGHMLQVFVTKRIIVQPYWHFVLCNDKWFAYSVDV